MRLEPASSRRGFVAVEISGERRFAPAPGELPLLARLDDSASLRLDRADGRLEPLSALDRWRAGLRLRLGAWAGAELSYPGVTLYPDGSRAASRRYRKHIETARRHLSAWDGPFLAAHPEIVSGWPPARPSAVDAPPRIAVAVHLHYTELWDEFETLLGRWRLPFRLFLTLNAADEKLQARVRSAFPGAEIRIVENRGRDVRPFLILLEQGAFQNFDLVCKLHGKRSLGGGRLPAFGDALRRANFHDLIADPGRVEALTARFDAAPDLGIVGSARFLSASTAAAPRDVLGKNHADVAALAARLEAPLTSPEFDFFEGTMFWVRPTALAPLAALRLSDEAFASEAGRIDGAPEHAFERLFNHVARKAGYRAETILAD
jgi:lipopolysaccharide biosynthesis protein